MGLAIGGVIANWFGVLIVYLNSYDPAYAMILAIVAIPAVISSFGLVIALANRTIGGVLIIIGSIIFIPLGLIGIFGGHRIMSLTVDNELELRRAKAKARTIANEEFIIRK